MSKTPNYDEAVKKILDSTQPGERVCELTGEKWLMDEEEISWYKKFNVPPSSVSPYVRRVWVRGFILGATIWWNKHFETGEPILSYVHPDNKIPVLPDEDWHKKDWGPEFAKDLDDRSFLDQLRSLAHEVPIPARRVFGEAKNTVGAGIVNAEDSFMVFGGVTKIKRCAYSFGINESEDLQEGYYAEASNKSFGLVNCKRMYGSRVGLQSTDCISCDFVFDTRNCENCFLSSNLRNRKYVFRGEQLSQSEYESKMQQVDLSEYSVYKKYLDEYKQMLAHDAVWPENFNVHCENSTGEYLSKCVRCVKGFAMSNSNDCFHSQFTHYQCQGLAFICGAFGSTDCLLSAATINGSQLKFCTTTARCHDLEYCMECFDCEHCFGCVGLKKKKFCILNKQYSEEEYWKVVDEIKTRMLEEGTYGQMLPGDLSAGGMEFVLDVHGGAPKDVIKSVGGVFYDPKHGGVVSQKHEEMKGKALSASEIPDALEDGEKFVGKAILDEELDRVFAVQSADYEFYKSMRLPLPRRHYMARLPALAHMGNTYTYHQDKCRECSKEIQLADNITFPDRKVYCMECYLKYLETNG